MVELSILRDGRSDAERKLDALRARSSDIDRRLRNMFGQRIVGHIQKNWLTGQALRRRTGYLANSITKIDEGRHATFVGSFGPPYARAHELGVPRGSVLIRPKHKKMLAWKDAQGMHFAKVVRMYLPKRPFIRPAIEHYFDTDMAEIDANKWLQAELDKVGT